MKEPKFYSYNFKYVNGNDNSKHNHISHIALILQGQLIPDLSLFQMLLWFQWTLH